MFNLNQGLKSDIWNSLARDSLENGTARGTFITGEQQGTSNQRLIIDVYFESRFKNNCDNFTQN